MSTTVTEWKPTKRQEAFLSIPDTVFEGLYGGAAGGGKTECLLMLPLCIKDKQGNPAYKHSRFKVLYLRRTFPELDNEVIPRSKEFYTASGATYQDQKKRWTWPSGAILQFGHCEHEKDVTKYDTAEYNIILFDEATSFTPYQYEYLTFSRCRTSSPDLPSFVRGGTNPGNIGHSYFRKRFVAPAKQGNVILRETKTVGGASQILYRIYIPSKVTDNPHLILNDPDYVNRLNRLPEKDRAAKADGDWWAFSGQVFDDFREFHVESEPSNALHVIAPFSVPDYWPRVLSIDWGYSAMTIAGWYAINPVPSVQFPAKIYKYREYSCLKTKISSWASTIAQLSQNEVLSDVVLDPSAWGNRGDEATIDEQFTLSSGLSPRKANNDRVAGKLLLQEYLRWSPKPPRFVPPEGYSAEKAREIYRREGPAGLSKYEDAFKSEPEETFLPKIQIFNTCVETIKALPLCVYKKDKTKQVTDRDDEGNAEDVEEFRGDDPYDETRYGVTACQAWLDSGLGEYEKRVQIAKACSKAEQPNASPSEITRFYIDMSNIEARGIKAQRPVRRFHGSGLRHANF